MIFPVEHRARGSPCLSSQQPTKKVSWAAGFTNFKNLFPLSLSLSLSLVIKSNHLNNAGLILNAKTKRENICVRLDWLTHLTLPHLTSPHLTT